MTQKDDAKNINKSDKKIPITDRPQSRRDGSIIEKGRKPNHYNPEGVTEEHKKYQNINKQITKPSTTIPKG